MRDGRDGSVSEEIEVPHLPEPDEPEPGVIDPDDMYTEGHE